jgi:serine/threonine protein kinase
VTTPRHIGKFDVVRLLATGGMGEVYLARQQGAGGFERAVVVKRLLPQFARDQQFVQMFLNEGRLSGMLMHPNIAQVYELGESHGSYYLAMEYVHGKSFRVVQRALEAQTRLIGPALAARICIQALRGLHAAHTLIIDGKPTAVVHRDLSPDNILVGFNGVSRVIDFGVARAADAASTTRTGQVKGKFAYMAPERFAGDKGDVDPRVDIYAMAVVLYEALCGRRPHVGSSEASLIGSILNETPPAARELNPLLDEELSGIIMKGLARAKEERWETAEAFATALESYLVKLGQATPESAVAAFMRALFGSGEADSNPSLSRGALTPVGESRSAITATPSPIRARFPQPVMLGVVALAAGLGIFAGIKIVGPASEPKVVALPPVEKPVEKPVPKPDPKPSDAPARKGRVAFRVKPWGEVWQGETKLGVTPNLSVSLPEGRTTFTVKNPAYKPKEIAVEVLPDTEITVKVDLTQS